MTIPDIKVGVLACQGSFSEHVSALKDLDKLENGNGKRFKLEVVEIRSSKEIQPDLKALIIPGGESTTLNIFLGQSDFFEKLKSWMTTDPVVWGTCAGMILLSNKIQHQKAGGQLKLGGMSITTSRNYFGRQKESFVADLFIVDEKLKNCTTHKVDKSNQNDEMKIDDLKIDEYVGDETFPGIFIRAPGIVSIDEPDEIEILSTLQIGMSDFVPVAVKQKNIMVTSFHPELTQDLRFHKFFVENILERFSI